jgi:hypothetical protein
MHRLLRELDRLDARGGPTRVNPRRELGQTLFVALVTTALVSAMGLVILHKQWGITLGLDGFTRTTSLGRPPEVATGIGAFAFSAHQPGEPSTPVAYDPCDEIHVVVNERLAPAGADGLVEEALTELSGHTGLQLVVDGPTDDLPGEERPSRKLTPQGWRWSPVLVAWSTPEDDPGLAGRVAGLGGSTSVLDEFTGQRRYVTGTVSLDTPALEGMLAHQDGRAHVRAVILHELAHVVGLAHVDDPRELMFEDNVGLTEFGPGDLEGLAALGSGRCFT